MKILLLAGRMAAGPEPHSAVIICPVLVQAPRARATRTLVAAIGSLSPWLTGLPLFSASLLALRSLDVREVEAAAAITSLAVGLWTGLFVLWLTRDPTESNPAAGPSALPLLGAAIVALVQFGDVLAVQVHAGPATAQHLAASLLARVEVVLALPALAWASAVTGRVLVRRLAAVASLVGLPFALFELAPGRTLSVVFGTSYASAGAVLRVFALADLVSIGAILVAGRLVASGRIPWVWSTLAIALSGFAFLFTVAAASGSTALAALEVQLVLLAALVVHALRLVRGSGREAVLILNWRDTANPEGGGSEIFLEEVGSRLVAQRRPVTMFCAAHPGAARSEIVRGVRVLRRGSRRTVYVWAFLYHLIGRFGRHEVVVDVQNGVPFLSSLYCHKPVVVLVHHVHREQWKLVFKPRMARLGWWIESRLAPRVYRNAAYVAVSEHTRAELVALGVRAEAIGVVRNGTMAQEMQGEERSNVPSIAVLGRLVPHKRVEDALEAIARLRPELPDLELIVMGRGYWEGQLRLAAEKLGIDDTVQFLGWVDDATKARVLARSWVLAVPSVKEGWGLAVMEAAALGTPAVGYRSAGGLTESVLHGKTGFLADSEDDFVRAIRALLTDRSLRERMGTAAREHAGSFEWSDAASGFALALDAAVRAAALDRGTLARRSAWSVEGA